jgi:hypothetical protein
MSKNLVPPVTDEDAGAIAEGDVTDHNRIAEAEAKMALILVLATPGVERR